MSEPDTRDSRLDTLEHVHNVQHYLHEVVRLLLVRAEEHDRSKLKSPEVETFAEFGPKLKTTTYGSEEYKGHLAAMKPALDHHYAHNRHHPEFFSQGIQEMTLVDLIELICDWKAASLRHPDGDLWSSIEKNAKRFQISPQLETILKNTARALFDTRGKTVQLLLNGVTVTTPFHEEFTYEEVRALVPYETAKYPSLRVFYSQGHPDQPQGELKPGQTLKVFPWMTINMTVDY